MKIKIDEKKCIGCRTCASLCPQVFVMKEDNKSHVIEEESNEKCVKDAIEACPVKCIETK